MAGEAGPVQLNAMERVIGAKRSYADDDKSPRAGRRRQIARRLTIAIYQRSCLPFGDKRRPGEVAEQPAVTFVNALRRERILSLPTGAPDSLAMVPDPCARFQERVS